MDLFNSDLVLHVVQYLNVVDSGRLAETAKRYYYLIHQYRMLRGPELVTVASWDTETKLQLGPKFVIQKAIPRMQKKPNLVLAFQTPQTSIQNPLAKKFPKGTVVLGAVAGAIQVNNEDEVEYRSKSSLMCASFSDSIIEPFHIDYQNYADEINAFRDELVKNQGCGWKAIIVYAAGRGTAFVEAFVSTMQRALPNVAIVGGICQSGYVSFPSYDREELSGMSVRELRVLSSRYVGERVNFVEKSEIVDYLYRYFQILQDQLLSGDNAVFGVALGGEAPVRSMVSRGVRSVTQESPCGSSPLIIQDAALVRPGDDSFMFRGFDHPIHMIRQIRDSETGKVMSAVDLMTKTYMADFIGVKRPSQDGFELHMLNSLSQAIQSYLIMTDGSPEQEESLHDAEIDFFVLDGDACLEDMDVTVSKLKEQTAGEQILGAVMYSCSGRGPHRGGLIRETMADAKRFAKGFPDVPCLGFYAGGEIGPLALAGNEKVFQTGRVAVQGFTAVFALFIVPVIESRNYHLDDCRENVTSFVDERLSN